MKTAFPWVVGSAVVGVTAFAAQALAQPAAEHDETRYLKNIRALTRDELGFTRAGEAYFSPDGARISFQAYPHGADQYQIFVMNVNGRELKMISTGKGATTCSYFHPDGKRLLFAANHHDLRPAPPPSDEKGGAAGSRSYAWSFFPGMDLYEYTFANSELRRLTDADGYDAECSYAPDGKSIVFASMRAGDCDIYICDADGKNARRVVGATGYDGGPFFSPDGKRIIYRSDRRNDGNMQIFANNLEGTAEKALTDHDVLNWCPYWHPSGKWLIFTRADHRGRPNYDLYLLRDDGSQQVRVTSDPAFDGLPVFSPDGRQVMWTSKRDGITSPHIFIADFHALTATGDLK